LMEAGAGPAVVSVATGQTPRFSCICGAPASCLLKSALCLFYMSANLSRQLV
jgi:hypothetical protein